MKKYLALTAVVAAAASAIIASPAMAKDKDDDDGPHREVVCHAEGNGTFHAIPPARASAHLPKHERRGDFVLAVTYDPKEDGKWKDVKGRYDALCNQSSTPTQTTTTTSSATSTSTSSTTTTSTATSTSTSTAGPTSGGGGTTTTSTGTTTSTSDVTSTSTSSPAPTETVTVTQPPTTTTTTAEPPILGVPISDGVRCNEETGATEWQVAYGDLSGNPFTLRVTRDGVATVEDYPGYALAEWTFTAPMLISVEQLVEGEWWFVITPFDLEVMDCPQPTGTPDPDPTTTAPTSNVGAPVLPTTSTTTAPSVTPSVTPTPQGGALAKTGADLATFVSVGVLVLLIGYALTWAARRPRGTHR